MSWVRIDDAMPDKPKVRHVGPLGQALHVAGICYSARHLTDGFLPESAIPTLIDLKPRELKALVAKMLEVAPSQTNPLWHRQQGGYQIHDYLEYNPNRSAVLAERDRAKQRMFGKRSGNVPANKRGTSPAPDPDPDPRSTTAPSPGAGARDPIDKLVSDFARFGTVNELTVGYIEDAVAAHGIDTVKDAVKAAAIGKASGDKPPWAYVESILKNPEPKEHRNGRPATSQRATGGRGRSATTEADMVDEWKRYAAGQD